MALLDGLERRGFLLTPGDKGLLLLSWLRAFSEPSTDTVRTTVQPTIGGAMSWRGDSVLVPGVTISHGMAEGRRSRGVVPVTRRSNPSGRSLTRRVLGARRWAVRHWPWEWALGLRRGHRAIGDSVLAPVDPRPRDASVRYLADLRFQPVAAGVHCLVDGRCRAL